MPLHNTLNKEQLTQRLQQESFGRKTLSFYRYTPISNPQEYRSLLFEKWEALGCLGRIYVAHEGINAQMSVPEPRLSDFLAFMESQPRLAGMPIKWAVEDSAASFLKLIVKARNKIVADGLDDSSFDTRNVGKHLSAQEFNQALSQPDTLVVDMRNWYESQVGRFEGALCPSAGTFREELETVESLIGEQKDRPVLMYCTGGVRCEKASAYLKHKGFTKVAQLQGGIIEYARQIKLEGLESKFKGKNFVFDQRLGERITADIIAACDQCGSPNDDHTNCENKGCHKLFIQCPACKAHYQGCCSPECAQIVSLPEPERRLAEKEFLDNKRQSKNEAFRSCALQAKQ